MWTPPELLPVDRQLAEVVSLTPGPWVQWSDGQRFVGQSPVGADVLVQFSGAEDQSGTPPALALAGALDWSDDIDRGGQIARYRVWAPTTTSPTTATGTLKARPQRSKRPHAQRAVRRSPTAQAPDWLV